MRNKSLFTSLLTLLALGGGLSVVDTAPAFAAPNCSGETFISCNVAKNKHLQICIEPANGDAEPKFTYQFTEKDKDGLSLHEDFSAKTVSPWKGVGRAITSTVTFNNEGYKYQVWQSFDRLDEEAELEAGVHIAKGDQDVASFTCQRDAQTKIAPLFALEDAMEQAGWCYIQDRFEWQQCTDKAQ
ncbi:hypothetical protein [Pseudochrobactrum asaccharolyticum]|uniref:Uncharacterized protein n=2 Tax=Brucellaceae TaxID=118882 RepID=A0A366DNW0_9HYPH|nr:hypothetical protein [Pseudochrobactrum asaccharolyticum]RBO90974.1 hypothetical protein DFR47_11169 [Pseudochrobactrum asaccharolyticum]